jgi:hypothetical protein
MLSSGSMASCSFISNESDLPFGMTLATRSLFVPLLPSLMATHAVV